MKEIIVGIVISIITGVISSYLFLMYFLNRKRVKIEISSYISKVTFEGQTNYFFKFINKTNSEIFDIRIEPTFYKQIGGVGGMNIQGKDIVLKDNFISYIPCKKKSDNNSLHAMRVRTIEDIESNWSDTSSYIRLTVIAKHSLSGFTDIFVKDFYSKDVITTRKFKSGDDLDVV
ncbi:hypothetical protein SAMN05444397_101675 [Flavobacterium aquidurense]|uniref:Late embryogenesis abundant protein LEA-2 subgroup domain-containing protein n=1 Tax=Flavobacterium frigidimaris TaxID=262320 RepID=A0ABX4BJL8_FLAFR|nr:hypothetical protein [Flavobacterium frigidimaris]OXA75519.1 hypothetical protein B0A65_21420 [Flavobacterium frigidimaris]SDY45062.1 hypothetical protein SAMN05444397_101675 [Flavobacterium aquidurense]